MDSMSPPFGSMPPWMWMMHPGMFHQGPTQVPIPDIIVPARVNKAMEFLSMMTSKQASRPVAASCDASVELQIIPGQKLTDEEANTVATACNLLSQYFAGKLIPDVWESVKVEAAKKHADQGGPTGRLLHCIACQPGPPRPNCPFCQGSGRVMITAVGSNTPTDPDES